MRFPRLTGIVLSAASLIPAQQKPASPAFEVASVRVSPPIGGQNTGMLGVQIDAGHLRYTNVGLGFLLTRAYGLAGDQISGIPNEFRYPLAYEILATFPSDRGEDQIPLMLQTLLADRFKLAVHRETRPTPVYTLVVAKNGPKLKVSQAETMSRGNPRRGHFEARKVTMAVLASMLAGSGWTDRPVLDQTGLTDAYDFILDWTPDDMKSDELSAPSLFTAVQEQLGLKLEPQTVPREFLVIDHVEKPADN